MSYRTPLAVGLGVTVIVHYVIPWSTGDVICPRPGASGPELPACNTEGNRPDAPPLSALAASTSGGNLVVVGNTIEGNDYLVLPPFYAQRLTVRS
jgi:hypothetical protein